MTTTVDETRSTAEAPTKPATATRPDGRAWLRGRIAPELAVLLAAAWLVLPAIATALEPAPAHPDAVPAWLDSSLSVLVSALFYLTLIGLAVMRRFGLAVSLAGAVLFIGLSIACPASGHHSFGAWWFGQMACGAGLAGLSVFALRRA
jgi:hypothetical protein